MSFLLLLGGIAYATVYEIEVPVGTGTEDYHAFETTLVSGRIMKGVAVGHADTTVSTSSPYVTCAIKDEDVHATIKVNATSWPSLPAFVDCNYGSDTLRVIPVVDASGFAWDGTTATPGVSPLVIRKPVLQSGARLYTLPTSTSWVAGTATAQLNGSAWTGVTCKTVKQASGPWYLSVQVADSAVLYGDGTCDLSTTGGPTTLDLVLVQP